MRGISSTQQGVGEEPPMRTPYGVEKVPRLPRPATPRQIETAVRDHPLRTPLWCEEGAKPA
eukprot:7910126-Pyramimonas_sp.AAC.1